MDACSFRDIVLSSGFSEEAFSRGAAVLLKSQKTSRMTDYSILISIMQQTIAFNYLKSSLK
jgi:hypothetical protein